MPTIQEFHQAIEAYLQIKSAKSRIAALQAEIRSIEQSAAAAQAICDEFLKSWPNGRELLDREYRLLRQFGLVQAGNAPSEISPKGRGSGAAGGIDRRPRTAAATAAAAAKRRALRAANPEYKNTRALPRRLQLFDEGFTIGYRSRCEDSDAENPYVKGDRSRGWEIGAQKAAEDIAAGIVTPGSPNVPEPPDAARLAYQAELASRSTGLTNDDMPTR